MPDKTYDKLISTEALSRLLNDPTLVILDCRFVLSDPLAGRNQYSENHLPGAHYVDLDEDISSEITETSGRHPLPPVDEFVEKLRRWGVSGHSQVVVYDDVAGAIAGRTWWLLRYLGHKNVALLDGGFNKWLSEGKPLVQEDTAVAPGNFSPEIQPRMKIETSELEGVLEDNDTVVIDARSPERYSGESESVDTEGGHIPGSINHYLRNNLDEHGCFRPAEELRNIYTPLHKPRVVHSCGSGVTACHNFLAMEIAGLTGGQLYVGSWSEWIRSPARPRVTGRQAR